MTLTELLAAYPAVGTFYTAFVRNAKGWIQADLVEMIPEQKKAKTVYGGDLGIVQKGGLPLDVSQNDGEAALLDGEVNPLQRQDRLLPLVGGIGEGELFRFDNFAHVCSSL